VHIITKLLVKYIYNLLNTILNSYTKLKSYYGYVCGGDWKRDKDQRPSAFRCIFKNLNYNNNN